MQKKRLALGLVGGVTAELFNKIAPLIVLGYATRMVGVQGFGVAQFGLWFLELALFFIAFGYQDIGVIEIGSQLAEPRRIRQIIGETLTLRLAHALVAVLGMVLCLQLFPAYRAYTTVLSALGFMLATSAIDLTFVMVGTQRMARYSALVMLGKVASLVAIISSVDGSEDAIRYAVLTAAANGFVSVASCLYVLRLYGMEWPTMTGLKARLHTAAPYALRIWLFVLLERFDLFVVEHFQGQVGTGLYSGPIRLVQSIVPLTITISTVFVSEMVTQQDREHRHKHLWLGLRLMILTFLPIVCGVWFVDRDILALIFDESFVPMASVLSILTLGVIGYVMIHVFGYQVMLLNGQMKLLNVILGVSGLFGIALSSWLVRSHGLPGVAIASVVAKIGAGLAIMFACRDVFKQFPVDPVVRAIAPSACMVAALVLVHSENLYVTILTGAITFFVAAATFNHRELRTIMFLVRRRLGSSVAS